METMNFGEPQASQGENSAPEAPVGGTDGENGGNKGKKGLIWAGVGLEVLIAVVGGWQYWRYINSPYYKQMQAVKEFEKFYEDDNIGGKTPEETLALYIEAIKRGDIDSAIKYVGAGAAKEDIKSQLLEYKSLGKFQNYVDLLIKVKRSSDESLNWNPDDVLFEVLDARGKRVLAMYIYKAKNSVWKIREI